MMPVMKLKTSAGDEQPAAPQHQRGARGSVRGARRVTPEAAGERDERGRQQPGDLAAHDVVEQRGQAGGAAEAAAAARPPPPARRRSR